MTREQFYLNAYAAAEDALTAGHVATSDALFRIAEAAYVDDSPQEIYLRSVYTGMPARRSKATINLPHAPILPT